MNLSQLYPKVRELGFWPLGEIDAWEENNPFVENCSQFKRFTFFSIWVYSFWKLYQEHQTIRKHCNFRREIKINKNNVVPLPLCTHNGVGEAIFHKTTWESPPSTEQNNSSHLLNATTKFWSKNSAPSFSVNLHLPHDSRLIISILWMKNLRSKWPMPTVSKLSNWGLL